jgi:hypothetical protein
LGDKSSAGDTVTEVFEARVASQHLRRCCLRKKSAHRLRIDIVVEPYFGIVAALEQRGCADQANVVVPQHGVGDLVARNLVLVLEYWEWSVLSPTRIPGGIVIPSKLSLPVFSQNNFFSLLYGICLGYVAMSPMG